jgi:hypothetical protein
MKVAFELFPPLGSGVDPGGGNIGEELEAATCFFGGGEKRNVELLAGVALFQPSALALPNDGNALLICLRQDLGVFRV